MPSNSNSQCIIIANVINNKLKVPTDGFCKLLEELKNSLSTGKRLGEDEVLVDAVLRDQVLHSGEIAPVDPIVEFPNDVAGSGGGSGGGLQPIGFRYFGSIRTNSSRRVPSEADGAMAISPGGETWSANGGGGGAERNPRF